ncbi:hypothetical protein EDB92DRAFT_1864215 [Lactarius akahatsu]|uniref:peptidylprolyl isomerase n=1 Tax=Lactarius akahatsu TaxID=416441 RepID=A0AAD4QD51_9AGAM|nr:hypothetical protein EDB92DRAFT_1864215 [Lactarius akahatsu]
MPVAVALWSIVVKPGEAVSVIPQGDLVITNAALGTELADSHGRTSVKLTYTRPVKVEDDQTTRGGGGGCSSRDRALLVDTGKALPKIEQSILNLTFEEDDEFLLEVVGKNEVYLTGNYIDQAPDQVPYNAESDQEDEYALDEVSSDVEIDPADMVGLPSDEDEDEDAGRFEEVVSEEESRLEKSAKRPRESNATEQDASTSDKPSKKAKKLKAENGAAVPAPTGTDGEPSKKGKKDKKKKGGDAKESHLQTGEDKESESKPKQSDLGGMRELPGGLKIQDAKLGEGVQAKKGVKLSMRYVGKLPNGKIFDSNTKGKPFTFRLGAGEVIKGWDEGIAGMKVGGERLLITDAIPPNSTLRFEVKVVDIK